MKRAAGDAVAIRDVAAGDGAEPHEIEVCVLQFERVKSPFDEADAALESVAALKKFQATANTPITNFRKNGGLVRMEQRLPRPETGERKREADHARTVESSEGLAACALRHSKKA